MKCITWKEIFIHSSIGLFICFYTNKHCFIIIIIITINNNNNKNNKNNLLFITNLHIHKN